MSSWKKIVLGVLIFSALQFLIIAFLIGTGSGLHLLFNAANKSLPGLEIAQITSSLRNLCLKDVHYQQSGVEVNIKKLHLETRLGCLRNGTLCVNKLSLKDIDIVINSKKIPLLSSIKKKNKNSSNLSTPYPIMLYQLELNNANIKFNDTIVSVINFKSGLRWKKKNLTLMPTSLRGLLVSLSKVTTLEQEEIISSKIKNFQVQKKFLNNRLKNLFLKAISPKINNIYIPLNLNIEEFKGEQIRFIWNTDNLTVFNMLIKASIIDGNMMLDSLNINTNQILVNTTGNLQLHNNWPIDINLNITLNQGLLNGEKIKLKLGGTLRKKLELIADLSGPVNMILRGQTQPAKVGPPLNLEIVSKQVFCPFNGNKQFQIDDLNIKVNGRLTNYTLLFHAAIKGKNLPTTTVTLNAKGNQKKINFEKLIVATLGGKTELAAVVNWQEVIGWNSNLKVIGIHTTKEIPEWPYKLNGLIKARSSLYGENRRIDLPEIKLFGNMKKTKLKIDGSLKRNNYLQWVVPGLYIALDHNMIAIKGEFGTKDLSLQTTINAPNFGNRLLGVSGSAKGFIKIFGTIEAPRLFINVKANSLCWKGLSIAKIWINGNITKFSEQISGKVNLRIEHIMKPGLNIKLATLIGKGNEKQHNLLLRVQGDPVSGELHFTGNFDRQTKRWKGLFNSSRFDTPVGPLVVSRTVMLDYRNDEKKFSIGPHCWSNQNIELCLPKTINVGIEGHAVAILKRFNLTMIQPFIPSTVQISGLCDAKADLTWRSTKKGLIHGKAMLSGHNVKLTQIINETLLTTIFNTLNLNVKLDNNYVQLDWLAQLTDNSEFVGQVKVNNPQADRKLNSTVQIRNFNLAIASIIFSRDINFSGILNGSLRLTGNSRNTQLFGQLELKSIEIDGNFIPFNMQPSWLLMHFNGMSSTLIGEMRTSHGILNLRGKVDWNQIDNWRARVRVKGSRIRITIPSTLQLDISPDVVFETTPTLYTLHGQVDVPWARIAIHDVPESIARVSRDEILLNKDLKPIEQKNTCIPINTNLIVRVGSNVQVNAFGLKTKLFGDLRVVQDKQGITLNGQINTPEGRFQAYGQDLIIRKGELLFSGSPDQAMINIEAVRNPDITENDVIAGVRITGSPDEPKVEVFSDPKMSKQEAISYLLRGQGLNNDQNDSAAITSMLVGLGITQSAQIVDKIGRTFGVSNLTLDTKGVGDSSQIVLSGYVLPSLQVKYGLGIFDSLSTLTLRYRLMSKLYLEAVSGIDQALNLLYQFDF